MTTIVDLLKEIRKQPDNTGICNQRSIHMLERDAYRLLLTFMTMWPKYSGTKHYPIRVAADKCPVLTYHKCKNMWSRKSKYGLLRWELLDWLIEQPELNVKLERRENGTELGSNHSPQAAVD